VISAACTQRAGPSWLLTGSFRRVHAKNATGPAFGQRLGESEPVCWPRRQEKPTDFAVFIPFFTVCASFFCFPPRQKDCGQHISFRHTESNDRINFNNATQKGHTALLSAAIHSLKEYQRKSTSCRNGAGMYE
jgi:hypothetical protein